MFGIEPDAHGVIAGAEHGDVADARQAGEIVDEIDRRVIAHEQAVVLPVRRIERHDLQDRGVLFLDGDALRLHRLRQRGQRAVDAVLHQHLIDVGIGADVEGHRQRIGAVGGAGRLHVEHLVDAVDLRLDRQRDGVDHRLRACAGIARRDLHGRRHDVRIFRDGKRDRPRRAPISTMTIASTLARTGCSMKNFDIMARVPIRSYWASMLVSLGTTFMSGRHAPEVADDDAIVGRKAGADDPQIADLLRRLDIALFDDVVLVDEHEIETALVLADGARRRQQRALRPRARPAGACARTGPATGCGRDY